MPEEGDSQELITIQEAAEALGVTTRTVFNYIKNQKLKAFKMDGRTLIPSKEVFALSGDDGSPLAGWNPETHVILERKHYESLLDSHGKLLKLQDEAVRNASEMGFRIGQLETEKRGLEGQVKLLEDLRERKPWWRRVLEWRRNNG